ncbi:hypothetical protein J437_LFUL017254 [Ladona fulva]|uniref:Uncharacterized protein n=1 Tax=Ladona fulva TaxID=123851 RepID=A0A8K0KNS3_LADFU|nr:hypothetical protein J437_LFUL017254 [Ladona fulva]
MFIPLQIVSDIRETFMILDASIRNYGDKLERHEGRERQLGETLRRALISIDKRVALLQRQSDEKSRELDRFLIQAEERERIQLQKVAQSVETFSMMLENRLSRIEANLDFTAGNAKETLETQSCSQSFMPKIENMEKMMVAMQNSVSEKLKEMTTSTDFVDKFEESLALNLDKSTQILEHLGDDGVQIGKGHQKEQETEELKTLLRKTKDNFDAVNSLIEKASNESLTHYKELESLINRVDNEVKALIEKKTDASHHKLIDLEAKWAKANEERTESEEQVDAILRDIATVRDEIQALVQLSEGNKKDLQSDIWSSSKESQKGTSDMSEALQQKIAELMVKLSPEPLLKTLTDMEHVMLQAADGVMDVGRRVEYSAARVIGELSEEIKSKSAIIESTITSRLDNLAASVLVNQTGAMETLSQRVESEISRVWRQIGIMYQQLTQSVGMLDKLQEQTEHYVNGSLKSMGKVQGRVGEIGDRVGEVEGNLNYLLGRLSLVTTEFNLVKAGLSAALDDVRRNMATVNSDIREAAPGTEYDHVNQVAPAEGP